MFTEDRAAFLSPDEFGLRASLLTFSAATGTGGPVVSTATASVLGIFDNAYQAAGEFDVASRAPRFTCSEDDLAAATVGSSLLLVGSATYRIVNIEPDGTGMAEAALHKVS